MRAPLLVITMAAFALPAAARTTDTTSELSGRVPGKQANCIDLDRVGGPIISGRAPFCIAILARGSG